MDPPGVWYCGSNAAELELWNLNVEVVLSFQRRRYTLLWIFVSKYR